VCLVDRLSILERFAAAFHDVRDVTGDLMRIKTTHRNQTRKIAPTGL
jgi:hypothetical protein